MFTTLLHLSAYPLHWEKYNPYVYAMQKMFYSEYTIPYIVSCSSVYKHSMDCLCMYLE